MNAQFVQERITKTKALIEAWEDALLALAGGAKSYTLDTGQNRQTVTKDDVDRINAVIDSLYNRCATLEARLNGSGSVTVRPCF